MTEKVSALMAAQRGLVLRRQALRAGLTIEAVARLVKSGQWVVVRRGVYATGLLWESLDRHRGRPLLQAWAASLNMSMPHVLSHESAALAHGMQVLRSAGDGPHVTRFGVHGTRTKNGVHHHLAPFTPEQVLDVRGVPTFDTARTAVDIARSHGQTHGLRHGIVACDSAMRAGVTRAQLENALVAMRNWPNVTIGRESVRLASPHSDGAGESLSRLLLEGLGLGEVQPQFGLREGGRTAWVDLRVHRHLVEFDGKVKYERVEDGGLSQDGPTTLWEEKQRQDWLARFKLGMSRLSWDDLLIRNWERTRARIHRDILDTEARWGTDLTDLAPYIIRDERRRL